MEVNMNRCLLEEQIQASWNTKDDIDLLRETILDKDLSKDEIIDALIGISQLHEMRCEKVFETFEKLISKGKILS